MFSNVICVIWINHILSELLKKIQEQKRIIGTLKTAETKMIRLTMKFHRDLTGLELLSGKIQGFNYVYDQGEPLWK